jgi:uncharacterized membrane protein YkvA (DUF1232 family)
MDVTASWYRNQISKVTMGLVYQAVLQRGKVFACLDESPTLSVLRADVQTMIYLMQDFIAVRYTEVSCSALSAMALAVLYFVNPASLVPTFIPDAEQTQPEKVFGMCLDAVRTEMNRYQQWAISKGRN